jgi:hypothetical protein
VLFLENTNPVTPLEDDAQARRKPPDPGYKVFAAPLRYADQVQLSSVLRPIAGRLRTTADIANATAWLRHHWRRRAQDLAVAGCYPFAPKVEGGRHQLANAMNCPVTFLLVYPDQRKCRVCRTRICPFCWARKVREHWLKIDAAFFPAAARKGRVRLVDVEHEPGKSPSFTRSVKDGEIPVNSPYDLIRRSFSFRLPTVAEVGEKPGRYGRGSFRLHAMRGWLESRIKGQPYPAVHRLPECRKILEAAEPTAGLLEAIHFRRIAGDASAYPWEVTVRQLIMAADGTKVPRILPEGACRPMCHIVIAKPKRRVVVASVAWALHYPRWIVDMRVPVDQVAEYLKIRRGLRLVATYGRFRVKHT